MASRPSFSDMHSPSREASRGGLPSPRIEHFDGEIPPALSPLDAFAAQGRLLARQLDESRRRDRRMSRLPPASVARSLSQPRPGYFRSPPSNDSQPGIARRPTQKASPEVEQPRFRPQSEHPRLSGIASVAGDVDRLEEGSSPYYDEEELQPPSSQLPEVADDYHLPRAESPEDSSWTLRPVGMALSGIPSADSPSSRLHVPHGLARPSNNFARINQPESSDDDYSSSNAGSTFSAARKLSSGSAMSVPHSPMSPAVRSHPRSPSISSETSIPGGPLPRPSFNFSRPLSRSSTSLSAPTPLAPPDEEDHDDNMVSPPPSLINRGNKPNPIFVPSRSDLCLKRHDTEPPTSAVSTYTYSKYSLPRGRMLSRDSLVFSGLQTPHFEWAEPLFENSPPPSASKTDRTARSPSPSPSRKSLSTNRQFVTEESPVPPRTLPHQTSLPTAPVPVPAPAPVPAAIPKPDEKDETTSSTESASTIRPQTAQTGASSKVALNADEHLALGIECHERGSLNESTYHLRIAAKQNHPTGMLLYALACRHGWGMRANQREGVQWLRKAVDSVGLELSDDSSSSSAASASASASASNKAAAPGNNQRMQEMMEQKAYRAQFALSIYELGVSHLNGWGIEQDKSLALRCFEIAGQWGDADALAEAGFCYAEGIGSKKDLKKAAKFYRMAEAKGMSMVGNSWIYKDKYLSDDDTPPRSRGRQAGTPEKKGRSKSRTRSIFQRKKSAASEHAPLP
ncbi:hypothetical protein ASPZODRAFT_63962 [Penicilliopsis zonata CBS 506.65]|uniref:Cell cycle inhibitor Nif1 n=1 Tax=Penicilliopsis zonata CBS 506.65 TaxID=1073090 RepID=A0A1L9SLG1_9EURO|nr:hypothetical protein ASPZODRAFT_63962 [Penicilliopsis zonata CBS 506.65]OJJ47924.1 hypothetical protein ASPZODRAFT_63962 [Penicilliopsis zonata CBS 506.65]